MYIHTRKYSKDALESGFLDEKVIDEDFGERTTPLTLAYNTLPICAPFVSSGGRGLSVFCCRD